MRESDVDDAELDRLLYASSPYGEAASAPPTPAPTATIAERAAPASLPPRRRSRAWVAPVLAVAVTGVILALVVQPFGLLRGTTTGTPEPSPSQSSETSDTSPTQNTLPEGLLGSGEIDSPDGKTTGRLEVSLESGRVWFRVLDLSTPHELVQVSLNVLARGDWCVDTGLRYAISGEVSTSQPITPSLLLEDFLHGDPTAVDEFDLYILPGPDDGSPCLYQSVARVMIDWKVPPLRAYLADLADAGERGGATGTVDVLDTGQRIYTVAPNDLIDEVADRFGMTRDDLFYLNEVRTPNPYDPMLYIGEELNLSLEFR